LNASGIPVANGTNTFTLNTTPSCSFTVNTAAPFTVNAGADQLDIDGTFHYATCGGTAGSRGWLRVNLTGSPIPSGGTALWTVVANNSAYPVPNYCIASPNASSTQFSGKPGDQYTLQYAVTNNGVTVTDQIIVRFNPCRTYTVTRNGGTNQHSFYYHTCTDLGCDPQYLGNGQSKTFCAFPGSYYTSFPTTFTITSSNNCN
jgi:hypothetical protein